MPQASVQQVRILGHATAKPADPLPGLACERELTGCFPVLSPSLSIRLRTSRAEVGAAIQFGSIYHSRQQQQRFSTTTTAANLDEAGETTRPRPAQSSPDPVSGSNLQSHTAPNRGSSVIGLVIGDSWLSKSRTINKIKGLSLSKSPVALAFLV